ncbi:DNA adenine methylase [Microvirga arabica]|uniref:DNA adenine methylase n=1 Tax=Microvirga arabica TaxID=1128671 RepID=UPI0019399E9C|nr:DNA adenine methylase [Microvirga arabica]MBM1174559.1 DNA adenine methylase [Microvirga arabica]
MKYMGSKRSMLTNGLGEALAAELQNARRFADLFTGSGAVAWHVATRWHAPVVATDLQQYAVSLADAVVARDVPVNSEEVLQTWIESAGSLVRASSQYHDAKRLQKALAATEDIEAIAKEARLISAEKTCGPTQRAYGGYYFSPLQALWIDALRTSLPKKQAERAVALAALIQASSRIAASPGHTAQPFKPNNTAGPFLIESWSKNVLDAIWLSFSEIGQQSALRKGIAARMDAEEMAGNLAEGDLAFIDPPYSAVHYSRFYHVLETVARGHHIEVSGTGRYPSRELRPESDFSIKTRAADALRRLLAKLSDVGARAIVTFPVEQCSNGLSGGDVAEIADQYFVLERKVVSSRFSTLGGNLVNRAARQNGKELILILDPK